jgi:hypothetical protein
VLFRLSGRGIGESPAVNALRGTGLVKNFVPLWRAAASPVRSPALQGGTEARGTQRPPRRVLRPLPRALFGPEQFQPTQAFCPVFLDSLTASAERQSKARTANKGDSKQLTGLSNNLCRCVSVPAPAGDCRAVLALIGLIPIFV